MAKNKINRVIRILIQSDIFLNMGWGFLAPVFAVFILQNIKGGDVKVAGFAAMVYWLSKSLLQIPIGKYLDKHLGEKDDFYFMVFGIILAGLSALAYLISYLPVHIYLCQIIQAIGMAMLIPSWCAVFTRHIDKNKEAYEWGLDSTGLGFATGIAGALGGVLAASIGFKYLFLLVAFFNLLAALLILLIRKDLILKDGITHFSIHKPSF